jgi:hypothetical protein
MVSDPAAPAFLGGEEHRFPPQMRMQVQPYWWVARTAGSIKLPEAYVESAIGFDRGG